VSCEDKGKLFSDWGTKFPFWSKVIVSCEDSGTLKFLSYFQTEQAMDLYPVHFFPEKQTFQSIIWINTKWRIFQTLNVEVQPVIMCVNHNEYTKCVQKYGTMDVIVHLVYQGQHCIGWSS
jgi:hypothetical protein